MSVLVTNNAWGTLAGAITNVAVSVTLTTGQGARFPAISGGNVFYATLSNSSNVLEIVKVTATAGDVFTIVRAQDGTTASAYSISDRIELRPTAALFNSKLDTVVAAATYAPLAAPTFTGTVTVNPGSLIVNPGNVLIGPSQSDLGAGYFLQLRDNVANRNILIDLRAAGTTGPNQAAQIQFVTSSANTTALFSLNDNSGSSQYFTHNFGSAVTQVYWNAPSYTFRAQSGAVTFATLSAGGLGITGTSGGNQLAVGSPAHASAFIVGTTDSGNLNVGAADANNTQLNLGTFVNIPLTVFVNNAEAGRWFTNRNFSIGNTTDRGSSLQVTGLANGQTAYNISTTGALGGMISAFDLNGAAGAGGGLLIGAAGGATNAVFAAIKGAFTNGGGNGTGDLVFSARAKQADVTLTESFRLDSSLGAAACPVRLLAAGYTKTVTQAAATTTTLDLTQTNAWRITMGTNITTLTLNNPQDGQGGVMRFKQDGTGNRTVAWPGSFRWGTGVTAPVLSTAASAEDTVYWQYDATAATYAVSIIKGTN